MRVAITSQGRVQQPNKASIYTKHVSNGFQPSLTANVVVVPQEACCLNQNGTQRKLQSFAVQDSMQSKTPRSPRPHAVVQDPKPDLV